MDYSLFDFLTLIGSLGLFLFGMKMMSEGLQKAANKKLKEFLSAMTSHRYAGVLMGMMITALIQSSSATTVLIVSFVNAGLINLVQSISVIMGANIGTTVTAWIISSLDLIKSESFAAIDRNRYHTFDVFQEKQLQKYRGIHYRFCYFVYGSDFFEKFST
jgi:phosphate:Na+ symporter